MLFVFTTWSEFDVLFINFCNIYIIIIYIVSVKCFCSQLSLLTQFVRTDTRMTIISFNKKHVSRELLSFKKFIYKEKYGTFTKWDSVNETLSANLLFFDKNLRTRSFILNICYWHHGNIIVEITDIKCGLLSKHLFERTQQHGGCTMPLGNNKFV